MRTLTRVLIIYLALQASLAWSQSRIPIQILVEGLGKQPCGLTKAAISGRVKLTLRQYGFTETENSNPYIYVNFNSLELDQQCMGTLKMEVIGYTAQDFSNGTLGWVKKADSRFTVFATSANIFTYPRYEFPARVLDIVEAQVKTVLGEIEY